MLRSATTSPGAAEDEASTTRDSSSAPSSSSGWVTPSAVTRSTKEESVDQIEARTRLRRRQPSPLAEHRGDGIRSELVELVDDAEHLGGVVDPQPQVVPLHELAVVDLHRHRRHRQPGERLPEHQGHLDLVVEGQRPGVDDVDICLEELAVPPLLRPLTAPHLLDLVAPKGKHQAAGVLQHVPRERHGEVEVQGELARGIGAVGSVVRQAADAVHLLVDLALGQQTFDRLDGSGLDRREAVQLEGAPQLVDDLLLDHPLGGQPLGEARQGGDAGHQRATSSRNGLEARSVATVVAGPWPGSTSVSFASVSTLSRNDSSIAAWSPPGRSVRPMLPANRTSPESTVLVAPAVLGVPSGTPSRWNSTCLLYTSPSPRDGLLSRM